MRLFAPQVLVGECHGWKLFWLEVMGWGRMFTQHPPKPAYIGEPWALDNGAFSAWDNNQPWDAMAYAKRVQAADQIRKDPMFAVLPDLPTKGMESLRFSQDWLNESHSLPTRWPYALALQDGISVDAVDQLIRHGQSGYRRIKTLFLGGSDEFKATAPKWADYAHTNGLTFHYARCGSIAKLRLAVDAGADSLDSVGIMRNERRDNSFWRFAMEWKHPTGMLPWKSCKEMEAANV